MTMRISTVPGRVKLMVAAAFYITASSSLFLAYLTSYFGPAQWAFYGHDHYIYTWAREEVVSIFGAINAICWLLGFAVMIDWLTNDDVKRRGYVERGVLWGVILKEIASVLFNIQPWSFLIDKNSWYLKPGTGVVWSNFVGVVFYLTGNCVEFLFLLRHYEKPFFQHKNWPIWGTFFAVSANWFIVTGNAYEYFNLAGTDWAPPRHPSVAPYQRKLIIPFQITGAILLILGTSWLFLHAYLAKPWEETVEGKVVLDAKGKKAKNGAVNDPELYEALNNNGEASTNNV
mmetsp:Transcript_16696/g.50608  ORF Transcript_16696/g.50608 Transcript_16696/m.50608 type:complete len:287 (+) Transcript_16696:98-958(+)